MSGLIHVYCGDGKGKTTAAIGLAVRASGAGKRVLFVQFFKNGKSSEIEALKSLERIQINLCPTLYGRFKNMNEVKREQAQRDYSELLENALINARKNADVLVLDEVISACNNRVVHESLLLEFLRNKPENLEVILTGRNPSETLLNLADYATEMQKLKHPYDKNIRARRGIEF